MSRIILWALSLLCILSIWYSQDIHDFLRQSFSLYRLQNDNLIQVILAVLAGIFATKASDSARELRRLLRVTEIDILLKKADEMENKAQSEQQRYHQEKMRYERLVNMVKYETEKQFARDMLIQHTKQLTSHWEQILALQAILNKEDIDKIVDERAAKDIQKYIIRTRYFQYMGRGFLVNIPLIGHLLDYLFGPIWDYWYLRNINKIQTLFSRKNSDEGGK